MVHHRCPDVGYSGPQRRHRTSRTPLATRRGGALLAMMALQGLCCLAGLAHGVDVQPSHSVLESPLDPGEVGPQQQQQQVGAGPLQIMIRYYRCRHSSPYRRPSAGR